MVNGKSMNGTPHDTAPVVAGDNGKHPQQRLLVVEDDRDAARLVEYALQRAGYEVQVAGSGMDAFDVIDQTGLPYLAVVDIMLPGMDGFEFCRRVQQYSDLPIVLLSAIE